MNTSHLTLRQAQDEDLMSGLSKHKVRGKDSRFLKCLVAGFQGPPALGRDKKGQRPIDLPMTGQGTVPALPVRGRGRFGGGIIPGSE